MWKDAGTGKRLWSVPSCGRGVGSLGSHTPYCFPSFHTYPSGELLFVTFSFTFSSQRPCLCPAQPPPHPPPRPASAIFPLRLPPRHAPAIFPPPPRPCAAVRVACGGRSPPPCSTAARSGGTGPSAARRSWLGAEPRPTASSAAGRRRTGRWCPASCACWSPRRSWPSASTTRSGCWISAPSSSPPCRGRWWLTCAFLACKVDEFNVSSVQFVGNLRESPLGQEKALEQILEYELLLIQQLNFHLIVHNPYRPFEGFLIDIKTRYPMLENPEALRRTADDFLNRVALTDAYLLFTPSQIALTAILSSASRAGINMESYLSESLMLKENRTFLGKLLDGMKCMKNLIKKYELPRPEEIAALKQKLEKCHSPEFSLHSNMKKRKGCEDDDYNAKKPKIDEEECTDDEFAEVL
uniref:Cyclin H n=1 Tax=Cairina moschata TaxID=8855 RepID=A0A8C3CMD4_CAIMO